MLRIRIVAYALLIFLLIACGLQQNPEDVSLQAEATDEVFSVSIAATPTIDQVTWLVDSEEVETDTAAPYALEVQKSAYEPGEHNVTAQVSVDILGEVSVVTRELTFSVEASEGAESLPISLENEAPEEKTAALEADKPDDANEATLTLKVYDADFSDEGELYINGQGPLDLFDAQASDKWNNKESTVTFDTPADWWQQGENDLRFTHVKTAGYRVMSASVSFSTQDDSTPTTSKPRPATGDAEPTLLASYRVRHSTGPRHSGVTYRPRQFKASPYSGWDVLTLPGGTYRTYTWSDWLTLELNRDATLVVLWDGSKPGSWLNSWQEEGTVDGKRAYRKTFSAGEVELGAIGGTANQPYTVLFAEANGKPSAAPSVPSGKETPRSNEDCPAWVHDSYIATGPDNKAYATWHPQIDPVYWCYFGHTHYSDPALLTEGGDAEFTPVFNYFADKGGPFESHEGFHAEVMEYTNTSNNKVYRLYKHAHADTTMQRRACAEIHAHQLVLYDVAADEIVANIHHKISFGPSRDAGTFDRYKPSKCPENANIPTSKGARNIPPIGNNGYETWQAVYDYYPQLGISGRHTVAYVNPRTKCADSECNTVKSTGLPNARVWVITPDSSKGEGVSFNADTAFGGGGTFYTDLYGEKRLSKGDSGAVEQYIKPGLDVTLVSSPRFFSNDPWRYRFTDSSKDDFAMPEMNLEDSLKVSR